mgnify:CR=1|tara:strand:+ start:158 stop:421 length:264 start_codon:yes stop_codon:yes gene_type:complete
MADFIATSVLQKSLLEGIQHSLSPIIILHPLQIDFDTNQAINCRELLSRGSREWKELQEQMKAGWKAGNTLVCTPVSSSCACAEIVV